LHIETGNVCGRGDVALLEVGMLSSIGDVVTEPTEIVETRADQGAQDLTETAGMLDFECNKRRGGRLYALAVALFCIC
jgi:hypothetical protein